MKEYKINATSADRKESDNWLHIYANDEERKRRRDEMPAKLARLGLLDASREIELLDLCCGHGEALDVFHSLGFKRLTGIDLTISEELAADSRFTIQQGDVTRTAFADESFDWLTCIHSLHHLASAETVANFMDESWRLLRPGGRLSILDFPGSTQIKLAFWFFRQPRLHVTPYLKYFGSIIQEEWFFLKDYLPQWPQVRKLLWEGKFEVERTSSTTFYYYLTLRKPVGRE